MILDSELIKPLLPKKIISRGLFSKINRHILQREEVTILYGARQVGKSTFILNILNERIAKGKKVFYYNLDYDLKNFITSPTKFIDYIDSNRDEGEHVTVFIDEAQRLNEVGVFVKYIYDRKVNIKFILTGSASLDIKSKVKESLTGRKGEFFLSPLSIGEFIEFKGIKIEKIKGSFPELQTYLNEYMLYGGYPQVVLEKSDEEKEYKLNEISDSYIFRDMAELFDLENERNIFTIAVFLAENIGNIVSIDNISLYTGIKRYEVEKISKALSKTYTISFMQPISKDKSKELVHAPKVFFKDNGIRNSLLNKMSYELLNPDKGSLFENTIYNLLLSKVGKNNLNFWRNKNQVEVDFIVQEVISQYKAYEVKFLAKSNSLPKNLYSFRDQYPKNTKQIDLITSENYWKLM